MPSSTYQAILLVDGYNVVGAWPYLQRIRDRDGLESARRELVESLVDYSAYQDFDTQVVFDAHFQDTPSSREIITGNVCICYTDYRQTADTYIERACSLFRKDIRKYTQRIIVATSDRAQQQTITGYGAEWMSAERLLAEVELAIERGRRKRVSQRKQQSSGRFLSSAIDPEARRRLAEMRYGLEAQQNGLEAQKNGAQNNGAQNNGAQNNGTQKNGAQKNNSQKNNSQKNNSQKNNSQKNNSQKNGLSSKKTKKL